MNKEIEEIDTYNVCSWGKLGRKKKGWREGERGRKRGEGEGEGEKDGGGRERVGEGEREGKRGEGERKKKVNMHMMVVYAHKLIVPLPIHPVSNHHPVQSSHYHNIHPFHHLMIHYVISHYQRQ